MMIKCKFLSGSYPYIVCLVSGMFIFYKFLLQISPSVMSHDLMRDFHLTGAGLGNLTASFLYTYLFMQIPAGILLDKYNPRTVIVTTITASAMFTLLFVAAHSALTAGIARAGIGLTAAFAFSAYLKVVTLWAPAKHFAFMTSLVLTIAMLGAIGGQAPLGALVVSLGWHKAMTLMAGLGFLLAFLCWALMRDTPTKTIAMTPTSQVSIIAQLLTVIKSKQNWIMGLYCGCAYAPVSAFGGLWGVPFLQQAYHLSPVTAAGNISFIYLGIAIGCPLFGWISDYLRKRITVMAIGTFMGFLSISAVIYLSHMLTPFFVGCLLFSFGFWISVVMLCFVIAIETQTVVFAATLVAFINTIPSIFEAITEPLIGKILDLGWDGTLINGARIFSVENFHVGLLILPCYLILGLILLMFSKESSSIREK